jgi:hypothetical protein
VKIFYKTKNYSFHRSPIKVKAAAVHKEQENENSLLSFQEQESQQTNGNYYRHRLSILIVQFNDSSVAFLIILCESLRGMAHLKIDFSHLTCKKSCCHSSYRSILKVNHHI